MRFGGAYKVAFLYSWLFHPFKILAQNFFLKVRRDVSLKGDLIYTILLRLFYFLGI
jgi:hypothetical protein